MILVPVVPVKNIKNAVILNMVVKDKIYGKNEIKESVLVELIKSGPVQRLKGIAQYGLPDNLYFKKGCSRYDHSLGVMLLLRKLGASLEEQVSGLLHDISHTAFSHVFDWVIDNQAKEDYQDKRHRSFFYNPEIRKTLKKYGFSVNRISNPEKFSLLEQSAPSLCADRLDYSLREMRDWLPAKGLNYLIGSLKTERGRIVFSEMKAANLFARNYSRCQREHWGGYEAVARYHLASLLFKDALEKKTLKLNDFYREDQFVINKLKKNKDEYILRNLKFLKQNPLPKKKRAGTIVINKKFRYVDPEVLTGGKIQKLSQLSPSFKLFLERQKSLNKKGIKVYLD